VSEGELGSDWSASLSEAGVALARWRKEHPWEVSVALVGTDNTLPGGFAQGWRDLDDPMGPAFRCHEHGLLLEREIHSPLDAEGVRQLAFEIGGQVEPEAAHRTRL
jgi:hypothetical protein